MIKHHFSTCLETSIEIYSLIMYLSLLNPTSETLFGVGIRSCKSSSPDSSS